MAVGWNSHRHNRRGVDYTCYGCPDYAEPAALSTLFIVVDTSVDPTVPVALSVATYDPDTGSYVVPNGEQDDLYAR